MAKETLVLSTSIVHYVVEKVAGTLSTIVVCALRTQSMIKNQLEKNKQKKTKINIKVQYIIEQSNLTLPSPLCRHFIANGTKNFHISYTMFLKKISFVLICGC